MPTPVAYSPDFFVFWVRLIARVQDFARSFFASQPHKT